MPGFTKRDKELLHELFSPRGISRIMEIIPGTTEGDWGKLYGKILIGESGDSPPSPPQRSQEKAVDLIIYTDGAADPGKGTGGIGGVFYVREADGSLGEEFYTFSEHIGKATNNMAEYMAMIRGLEYAKQFNCRSVSVRLDSELVVKQLNLEYKVKSKRMMGLYRKVTDLLREFDSWDVCYVPRSKNRKADILSKQGLSSDREEKG